MKNLQTVVALLTTAILCICLVSCDRKVSSGNEPKSESQQTVPANMLEITTASTTNKNEKETDSPILINPTQSTGTTTHTDNIVTPTKPATAVSSTTATDASGVPTTVPSTNVAKTTTTAAATKPVATVPSSTAVSTTAAHTTEPAATRPTTTKPVTTRPTTTKPATTKPSATVPPAVETPTDIIIDSEDMDSEQMVISIVNRFRIAEGLGELSYSHELSAAADIRAKELAVSFSNIRPVGGFFNTISPLAEAENIAKDFTTADQVTAFWAKNEGYRNLMLTKKFTITGVGCYYDNATDTYYWVQLFG